MMTDSNIRAALERHWAASDANDFDAEHQIYRQDAVLEYPQSGERIRGRDRIQASRMAQPNYKRFSVRRIIGAANLWVTEFILTYDGQPSHTVSIMEFEDEQVIRETNISVTRFSLDYLVPNGSSECKWPVLGAKLNSVSVQRGYNSVVLTTLAAARDAGLYTVEMD